MNSKLKFRFEKVIKVIVLFGLITAIQYFPITHAVKSCHYCEGINCQRTSYQQMQDCDDTLDICVTTFKGAAVEAQGCLQQIPPQLRRQCTMVDVGKINSDCYKCNTDNCNNVGAYGYACIQCNSNENSNCRDNVGLLQPEQCGIPSTLNSYCYVMETEKQTTRGCSLTLSHQQECLSRDDCLLCSPNELETCNGLALQNNASEGGGGTGGSGNGGNGGGDGGNGSGGGGSNGGGSGNGGNGSDGSGSGGNGGDGGSGNGGSEGGTGGNGNGGSGGNGGSDGGNGSGGGSGNGGNGSDGSGSGGNGGDGGSGNGGSEGGNGSGDGGSNGGGSGSGGNGGSNGDGNGGSGGSGSAAQSIYFNLICLALSIFIVLYKV